MRAPYAVRSAARACRFQKFLFAALLWTAMPATTRTSFLAPFFFFVFNKKYGVATV